MTACGAGGPDATVETGRVEPTTSIEPTAAREALPTTAGPSSVLDPSAPAAESAGAVATVDLVIDKDIPYYETGEGRTLSMDVYYPEAGKNLPLVVVFHGNPVFGQTKDSVRRLARAVAEQGAVVFAPTWGSQMGMDMERIADAIVTWNLAHGPCAAWTALELADSYGADPAHLIVVGVTTGVLPGQAITFGTAAHDVHGCSSPSAPISVKRAILFDTDWFLVPSIWDDVLRADPGFLRASSYWEAVVEPSPTQVRMLFGEHEASDTVRSLEGVSYEESDWIGIRDPGGTLAGDFAALGVLDDGSMSFADVTRVVTARLVAAGWDAEIVVVPGAGHSLGSSDAIDFVAALVLADE